MNPIIPNLAIAGYRSFGKDPQYFPAFSKVNFFIGKNNAGKSNVLRFLHDIYPKLTTRKPVQLEPLEIHQPDSPRPLVGRAEEVLEGGYRTWLCRPDHPLLNRFSTEHQRSVFAPLLGNLFNAKRIADETTIAWSFSEFSENQANIDDWKPTLEGLTDEALYRLWHTLTNMQSGNRESWTRQLLSHLAPDLPSAHIAMVPAIRQVGKKGSSSDGFAGNGLIDKLAEYERPSATQQADKEHFRKINAFVQSVLDNPSAKLEVPYQRDTLLVDMDGKILPLESLGSGIHEVIILAAAATVLHDHVVCIEEPELHLNPILQKKLVRYLGEKTSNQYFITTHSAALMDTPGAEIYHITLVNGCSEVERVTSDSKKSAVCEDLGYHPSDLLQANCVIWVEGPSDRIYVAYWLKHVAPELIEGIHFSIMFYGGRLASHLSNEDIDGTLENFISLRRLNVCVPQTHLDYINDQVLTDAVGGAVTVSGDTQRCGSSSCSR
ncbi:MAG: hypothetical protein RIS44_3359, partial [Pseudomonadota bacterium]